jgi:hypothetical protein
VARAFNSLFFENYGLSKKGLRRASKYTELPLIRKDHIRLK